MNYDEDYQVVHRAEGLFGDITDAKVIIRLDLKLTPEAWKHILENTTTTDKKFKVCLAQVASEIEKALELERMAADNDTD